MHLVEAADWKATCATGKERRQNAAAKLKQFNAAVGALAESDLLSLSPPALRLVSCVHSLFLDLLRGTSRLQGTDAQECLVSQGVLSMCCLHTF